MNYKNAHQLRTVLATADGKEKRQLKRRTKKTLYLALKKSEVGIIRIVNSEDKGDITLIYILFLKLKYFIKKYK